MLKTITASLALLGLAAAAAHAGSPAANEPRTEAQPGAEAAPQTQDARRVVRDRVTGKLRAPTAEEEAAMAAAAKARTTGARSATGQAPVALRQHANGMRSAVLGREYLSTLKAQRQADGTLVIRHANPADEHAISASTRTEQ